MADASSRQIHGRLQKVSGTRRQRPSARGSCCAHVDPCKNTARCAFLRCRYSDRIPFRERSETASIAIELSLQPWDAFSPDGVIMFSDILTPLPALGIEFDVVKGKGPIISSPVRRCAWPSTLDKCREHAAGDGARATRACKQPSWHVICMTVVLAQFGRCAADEDAGRPRQQPAVHPGDTVDPATVRRECLDSPRLHWRTLDAGGLCHGGPGRQVHVDHPPHPCRGYTSET